MLIVIIIFSIGILVFSYDLLVINFKLTKFVNCAAFGGLHPILLSGLDRKLSGLITSIQGLYQLRKFANSDVRLIAENDLSLNLKYFLDKLSQKLNDLVPGVNCLIVSSIGEIAIYGVSEARLLNGIRRLLGLTNFDTFPSLNEIRKSGLSDLNIKDIMSLKVIEIDQGTVYFFHCSIGGFFSQGLEPVLCSIQKKLQNELELFKRSADLNKKLSSVIADSNLQSQFYAELSHDVRAPICNIKAILSMISADGFDADSKSLLKSVDSNCEILNDLLDNLIDWCCLKNENYDSSVTTFNLTELGQMISDSFLAQAKLKNLQFSFKSDLATILIESNPTYVKRLLSNLLNNAIKYTDKGAICCLVTARRSEAIFSVIDSGRGIPADKLHEIFNPFQRLARDLPGAGLGLAISKRMAQVCNANIEVRSELGYGSTFSVGFKLDSTIKQV